MLLSVTEALYEDEHNDPYDGGDASKIGFTAAAITQLCRELGMPIHIKWQSSKIESYRFRSLFLLFTVTVEAY